MIDEEDWILISNKAVEENSTSINSFNKLDKENPLICLEFWDIEQLKYFWLGNPSIFKIWSFLFDFIFNGL